MLWQVDENLCDGLIDQADLASWYQVMGTLGLEEAPHINDEEAWRWWQQALEEAEHSAAVLFRGTRSPADTGGGDPHVVFIDAATVSKLATTFAAAGKETFLGLLRACHENATSEIWYYDALTAFLKHAASQSKAVVYLLYN